MTRLWARARIPHAGTPQQRAVAMLACVLAGCASPEAPIRPSFDGAGRRLFRQPVPLVETPEDDLAPSVAGGCGRLAYAGKSGGNLDIFVRSADGSTARLTTQTTDDTEPAFSPDGTRIAWVSQEDDVKGDIWVMDADGSDKQRLTDRSTSDRAPAFSPGGGLIFFTSSAPGSNGERIDSVELATGLRSTVVGAGWDPAPSPDGRMLFYAALGDDRRPRLFAKRLSDGQVAAITDAAYIEGLPRARGRAGAIEVVFARFVDDQDNDGVADSDDPASLWSVRVAEAIFDGAMPEAARPLTAGAFGDILVDTCDDWIAYTTGAAGDLDIYAVPVDGLMAGEAQAKTVLEAARAQDDVTLRRFALRYVIAAAPDLVAEARYELARELAERDKRADAIDELQRTVTAAGAQPLALLARIEIERLRLRQRLEGRLTVRDAKELAFAEERLAAAAAIAGEAGADAAVTARARSFAAEGLLALGQRDKAARALEALANDTTLPAEDGARALDRLGEIYAALGERQAVARVSQQILSRFGAERYYARRAARRWVDAAQSDPSVPPLAALEEILREHGDLAAVGARAALAMATLYDKAGESALALERWRDIASSYPSERRTVSRALLSAGETYERIGDGERAVTAYERLINDFGDTPATRAQARRGLVRIAMSTALLEEKAGDKEKARKSYERLLRNDRSLVAAHRRYISLSAQLGRLAAVLAEYAEAASERPRDKVARYGYGFALTFVTPVPLDEAEREIAAALEIDPRFAAAHLTRGWIREQRERVEPGRNWLETAQDSYSTAAALADPVAEAELVAAAQLNQGNVLFALDKLDFAFDAYLARELSPVPYDSPLTELLFRESFARVAFRRDAFDVALDMADRAYALATALPGNPRLAAITALLAAIHLQVGMYADALEWYGRAKALYVARGDWERVIPLVRGESLACEALGRWDEALARVAEIVGILEEGHGAPEPAKSVFRQELPKDSKDITRAVYGFSGPAEEELARAAASRMLRARGQITEARALDARRLGLLREAMNHARQGPRIGLEVMTALDDSAHLALAAGEPGEAIGKWLEAATLAHHQTWWPEMALLLANVQGVWTRFPAERKAPHDRVASTLATEAVKAIEAAEAKKRQAETKAEAESSRTTATAAPPRTRESAAAAAAMTVAAATSPLPMEALLTPAAGHAAPGTAGTATAATAGMTPAASATPSPASLASPATSATPASPAAPARAKTTAPASTEATPETLAKRRLARFLALEHLMNARRPPTLDPEKRLAGLLAQLDDAAGEAELAREQAQAADDPALEASIAAFLGDDAARDAAAARVPPPVGWRAFFDASVRGPTPDAQQLRDAIAAFESAPTPADAPERGAFLEAATAALVEANDTERAWRLLERDRLLALQPDAKRVSRDPLAGAWAELRAARPDASKYQQLIKAAPALLLALEGQPIDLARLRIALDSGAALLQAFAPSPERWHWFLVTPKSIQHVATPPLSGDALPAAVAEWLELLGSAASPPLLHVDLGALTETPAWALTLAGHRLIEHASVVESLSATYLVASRDLRNVWWQGYLVIGDAPEGVDAEWLPAAQATRAGIAEVAGGEAIIHLALASDVMVPLGARPGATQITFAGTDTQGRPLDLTDLSALPLNANLLIADGVAGPHGVRALAQAALLAGIPTVLTGAYARPPAAPDRPTAPAHGALLLRVATGLSSASAACLFADLIPHDARATGLRLFGDPGLDAAERVTFAFNLLLELAKPANKRFTTAETTKLAADWRAVKETHEPLVDVLGLLLQPENLKRLKPEAQKSVSILNTPIQAKLGRAKLFLGEADEGSQLLEAAISYYASAGKPADAATATLQLGKGLAAIKRTRQAAEAFRRCADYAKSAGNPEREAECSLELGNAHRALFERDAAVAAYERAAQLFASKKLNGEAVAHRFLGFVYESLFNDYDKALAQFQAAVAVAQAQPLANVPLSSLILDMARIDRLRGDYERALDEIQKAQASLPATEGIAHAELPLESAKIHWYRGRYAQALELQRQALEVAQRIDNSFLEIQAVSLAGLIDLNRGELAGAERSIAEALMLARLTGRTTEEAKQLNNLGIVQRDSGRLDEAIATFRAALAIDEKQGDTEGRAYDLRNLGVALMRKGDNAGALAALDGALELSVRIGNSYNELQAVFYRAELSQAMSDPEAHTRYEKAATMARLAAVPEVEWRSLYALGRLAEARGDVAQARTELARALEVAEQLGRGRSEQESGRGRDDLYDDAIRLAVAASDVPAAHLLIERARARNLLDILATRQLEMPSREARELVARELTTREGELSARRALDRGVAGAAQALAAAEGEHEQARAELWRRFPTLGRALTVDPVSLSDLQAALPKDTLVVSYFVGREQTTLVALTRDRAEARRLPVGRRDLVSAVTSLRGRMAAFAPVDKELTEIAERIIDPPLLEAMRASSTIIIVPHGALQHVPFAALPIKGQPLLTMAALSQAPSLSVLKDALGEPTLAATPATVVAMAPASDLPFARLEALAVAGAGAILGAAATEAKLRSLRVDALDIAAHVELDESDPLSSGVVLARGGGGDDNGRLELREVFGLAALPRLLSLSSCSSASSGSSGDEWLSLANAFFAAGSRTVVASRERVSDAASAVLIRRFYRLVVARTPTAEALRQAMLWTRSYFPHPSHWASFVLIGDFR